MRNAFAFMAPHWPAPKNVKALVTSRERGGSKPPFDYFNMAEHVGDNPANVAMAREDLQNFVGKNQPLLWLNQTHSTRVAESFTPNIEADAAVAFNSDYACVVMTADCLPVFFCSEEGDKVGVAHAGWRGLADGVLEATLDKLNIEPEKTLVWLGPAISSKHFEVGDEVRQRFVEQLPQSFDCFEPSPFRLNHYMADLYQLARLKLAERGVDQVYGGAFCTYAERKRFYSYRRDGQTGRMASIIWLAE
ncbi:peptidoglycan editing factor PgeF [Oceanospirillum sp.]|uniref:peptidoglycan editing factor PgeF n=1 Tax=Oceanospirillum sp. TaxID=2021254 RepID=UPI003A900BAA